MLDLLLRLIDKCIDFLKRREESKRRLYDDFVAPAFSDFESLHEDYLERFRKYRQILVSTSEPFNPRHTLYGQIEVDTLFSASHRAKVRELESHVDDPVFGAFVIAIIRYVRFDSRWKPTGSRSKAASSALTQAVARVTRRKIEKRVSLVVEYQEQREKAIEALDEVVGTLQENYAKVVQEFIRLKSKLLRPH
jgi:hypothetical protein